MKNLNFTKKYTDRTTINSNNCAKFEVNWPRGSQFIARHTKNRLQFDEYSPITLEWKTEISPKSIQTIWLSIPISMRTLKCIGQGFTIYSATYEKLPIIWRIKSHNSGMKFRNFTIKHTERKTINSNNSANLKWIGQGILQLERDMWNGRTHRRTDERTDGRTDGDTDGQSDIGIS
jgi:hypothetical protein